MITSGSLVATLRYSATYQTPYGASKDVGPLDKNTLSGQY